MVYFPQGSSLSKTCLIAFIMISDHRGWNVNIKWRCLGPWKHCSFLTAPASAGKVKKAFFKAVWVGKSAQGQVLFLYFITRDRCHTPQQSLEILVISCHCHIMADGWSSGSKGLAQREVQVRPPLQGPCTSPLSHSFPQR